MEKLEVIAYKKINRGSKFEFNDGSELIITPNKNWGMIVGLNSVSLYKKGILEALATEEYSRYFKLEKGGFWSRSLISQKKLAEYWDKANKKAEQLYDDYENGKIKMEKWNEYSDLWKIANIGEKTKKELIQGKKRVFNKIPNQTL